ncbi:MAG: hypothetical protein M5T61_03035 [Acidimicrobiia bacterium]|nr:hypothetical protein [Acidimicrobiia bacterium]
MGRVGGDRLLQRLEGVGRRASPRRPRRSTAAGAPTDDCAGASGVVAADCACLPAGLRPSGVAAAGPAAVAGARHGAQRPASPGAPGAHATSGASAVPMPALIGAAIALVGALLPWIRGVAGLNAFDVPIQFLVDYKTSGRSSVNVGMFLVAASIAAAVLAIQPGKEAWMRACGWGCVLLGVAHMAQLYRLADNYGGMGFPKVIGAGVYLTVAGGLVVALSPRASR